MIRKITTKQGETKWEARLRESGRGSKYQSRRFDRKIDAERFIDQLKYDREQARTNPFATTKLQDRHFKEEAELWLADAKLSHSPSHLKRMEGFFAEFLPLHGQLTMDKFTPEFFSRFQQQEKLKGLENSTIDKKYTMIQTVLNFSVNQRRIPFSPTLKLRKLSRTQNEMLFWNQDEALGFLSFANEYHAPDSESRWVYVAYLTALNTGLRAGEIWGLQPQDISADGKSIHVRRQWNRVSHSYTPTISKKGRLVPCQAHLADELCKLIAKRRTKPDQPIFAGEEGRPINHDSFTDRRFEMDVKRWGGKRIRFHDMRHTATTLMLANGVDYKTVQEVCGHSSFKTTMNYVHLLPGHVERVLERFGLEPAKEVAPNAN